MSTNTQKLRVLRGRTDYDLVILVQRELDRGFALVDVARSRNSPLLAQAEKALATATRLVPRIAGMSTVDRLQFETRISELKAKLAQAPVYANLRAYPTSFAS
jgi:hypothetical protein